MHQQQQSFTMSRALHGNNFALVRMVPGAPARTGGWERSSKEEAGAFSCTTGAFHHFYLMLLVLMRKKRQGSKESGCE